MSEDQAKALLKSHNPLADIYKEWNKTETHHMNDVREVIEARADAVIRAEKEKGQREGVVHLALSQYLQDHPNTNTHLHLDNDGVGREAAVGIMEGLRDKYTVLDRPPPYGKDVNDTLQKPDNRRMFTEKCGTHQCMLAVWENVMCTHHATVDDTIINRVLRFGTADIQTDYLNTIQETATGYVREIFRILREHEYNPALMRLYVLGGGSCLIRNFGEYDADRADICDDICATAKGYEYLCEQALRRGVRE